jgi:hypothetical protein
MADKATTAFTRHEAFEHDSEGTVAVTTTPFEATVVVGDTIVLSIWLPTLDAAVADETVAPVVEDGWFDTLERRLENVPDVTSTEVNLDVAREDATVAVETTLDSDPARVPDDAKAIVDFVEGTWVQGMVPGYDYEGPGAELLAAAKARGQT